MTTHRRRIGLAVGVVFAAAIVFGLVLAEPRTSEIPTMTAASGPFRVRITAEGILEAVRNTTLTAPIEVRRPPRGRLAHPERQPSHCRRRRDSL